MLHQLGLCENVNIYLISINKRVKTDRQDGERGRSETNKLKRIPAGSFLEKKRWSGKQCQKKFSKKGKQ